MLKTWFTHRLKSVTKWFTFGIGVKRWLLLILVGIFAVATAIAYIVTAIISIRRPSDLPASVEFLLIAALIGIGMSMVAVGMYRVMKNFLAPYRANQQGHIIDAVYAHNKRHKGITVVAIGGGTGLPSVLRGLKLTTSNITAIVTVADDGGSSGRLRRELGVLPPGDLRNNIAALADDENLMTHLFQYRFDSGDLGGHAFGNLFITALSGVTGSIETALVETARVLNIQGRVLPATLDDVNLMADVRLPDEKGTVTVYGESQISEAGGHIEKMQLNPANIAAYGESVQAILHADLIVIGPGSLFTSILPNLLVQDIAEALRATRAYTVYVCNVATQPGETEGFTVADHVIALEKHIGRGVFKAVLANNVYPVLNAGDNTHYVTPAPQHHEISQRYEIRYTDLTDTQRPWRHDPGKLANAIMQLATEERSGMTPG
ncbi:MAG: YvcK family protein [Anaerolineaceae bacterium]|nr:YvcK family protein [Anaerolineaceae bacterium]